jgi:hypothetical protein
VGNGVNVRVQAHDDERTSSAADTIPFVDLITMGASNIRVIE